MAIYSPALVIFDCDGVLVDSEVLACAVEMKILGEIGHPIDAAAFRRGVVGTKRADSLAFLERAWGRPLPADYAERVGTALDAAFRRDLAAVAGMPELVASVAAPICVASSSAYPRLRLALDLAGYAPLFGAHVFSSVDVAHGKPAPDLFLHAAAKMDAEPERCLVIEDSLPGVRAGKAAGMTVIGFAGGGHCGPGHAEALKQAGADLVAADAPDLAASLRGLGLIAGS